MMEAISEEENDEEESDDLSRLSYLDGSVILDTLRQRYRLNKYYVCIKLKSYCPRRFL
jgi:myosin heavy subunit